jgi:DNA helicase II / ATP-dependent DNA helicase PcrA
LALGHYRLSNSLGFQPPLATELGYGKTIHHVLRRIADLVKDSGEIPTDKEFETLFNDEFYMPFANHFAFQELSVHGKALIDRYLKDYKSDLERVWEVERPFSLHLENGVVTGRADVILDYENGVPSNLALVDYKTAAGEEVDGVFAFQLAIYAAAGRGEGLKVDAAYLHQLKEGDRESVAVDGPTTEAAKDKAAQLIAGMAAGDFPAKAHRKKCRGCDVRAVCGSAACGKRDL